jgi:hypothetical protein
MKQQWSYLPINHRVPSFSGQELTRWNVNHAEQTFRNFRNFTTSYPVSETRTCVFTPTFGAAQHLMLRMCPSPVRDVLPPRTRRNCLCTAHHTQKLRFPMFCCYFSSSQKKNSTQTIRNETSNRSEKGISGLSDWTKTVMLRLISARTPTGATNPSH